MDVANVHHHLAVLVPKTFHTPRTVNYWNGSLPSLSPNYYPCYYSYPLYRPPRHRPARPYLRRRRRPL